MPIYEYRCTSCGHELEALQKLSDAPLTECPACHRAALSKKVSAAGFQLKGSGWYVTDFRNKGAPKQPAKDAAKPADKPDGGADSKAEKAPAAASESPATKSDGGASESKSTATTAPADKTGA